MSEGPQQVLPVAVGRPLDRGVYVEDGQLYDALEGPARAVIDLSGRPWPEIAIGFDRERIGDVATENITHFFRSFALEGRMALHIDLIRGDNDHHKAEAAFKALALAVRAAVTRRGDEVPSTKGSLR